MAIERIWCYGGELTAKRESVVAVLGGLIGLFDVVDLRDLEVFNIGNSERLEGDSAELDQLEHIATGFRRYALKKQQGQNRVLAQYRAYLRAKYKDALPAEETDADVDAIGFPEPVNNIWQPMIKEMRQFAILVAKHTPPRNKKHRHVSYTTLISVAERLVF
ncbi:hypothetical protein QIS74_11051 [Colletotrichum tabaci]|uniref:Uncharacterized protein n=1 Tax=Colletotrichum tabaci TaxID=1209068 RepID=A0AAV9SX95_9PEZI